jgi:hypothetical protein
MKHWLRLPVAGVLGMQLLACGGGGDLQGTPDASAPVTLKSADEVAAVVVVAGSLPGLTGSADSSAASASPTLMASAKTLNARQQHAVQAKAAQPKGTSTRACNGGGSASFTTDDGTLYAEDGSTVASQCVDILRDNANQELARSTANGRLAEKCVDSAQTTSNCASYQGSVGQGSTPFSLAYKEAAQGGEDSTSSGLFNFLSINDANGDSETLAGTLTVVDHRAQLSGTLLFDQFQQRSSFNSGVESLRLDGGLGFASNTRRCFAGKLALETLQPVTINGSGVSTSGRVAITDGSNTRYEVEFLSGGAITFNFKGQQSTYTLEQLASFCQ